MKASVLATQAENFDTLLNAGLDNLFQLNEIYHDGTIIEKRQVIGSIYPEKLTFDGDQLRTTRVNEVVRVIYTLDKAFSENEKRTKREYSCFVLSSRLGRTILEPVSVRSKAISHPNKLNVQRLTFVFRFVQSFLKSEGNVKGFDYTNVTSATKIASYQRLVTAIPYHLVDIERANF